MPTKLGQNFLKGKVIVEKIVEAANLQTEDFVLEIGPGKGILTKELTKVAGKIVAVEIDEKLIKLLRNKFGNIKNLEIIQGDILKMDLNKILTTENQQPTTYKIVANLPYYITSPIIRLFLECENPCLPTSRRPSEMILMVQKEVAERIVALPGQMSILAVSVQYYAKAELLFHVGKENFEPIPEVDSAVIRISRITKPDETQINTNDFFRIVKAGFSAKRKTLANNLSNSFHLDKNLVEEKLKTAGLKPTVRAQELSMEDWKKLINLFEKI